ncbi:MAG: hypothetical protein J0H60_26335 [Rhizobiales bacterium]|nr:hypothetical protein [Hyphomicrobiales bacterium]
MPFRAMVQDGVLTSGDLDFLQDIYDTATMGFMNIDDAMMHAIVQRLILHYRNGERDKEQLVGVALDELRRAAG